MLNKLSPELLEQNPPAHYPVRWLILSLAVILCITFFPYLFGGKTFLPSDFFDTMTEPYNASFGPPQAQNHYVFDAIAQEFPYKFETKSALERNTLAYWNPYILGGYPQYAEPLGNNFDPFNIFLFWLNPSDAITAETIIELLTAGIGMVLLLRFFGISPIINVLFASAYMLNSMFISSAHYRCPVASFCWIPFVALMIVQYFTFNKKQKLLYTAGFLALVFLGGNYQTSVFAAFVVLILVLFYPSKISDLSWRPRLGILTIVGVGGFALSAVMWLPSLELLYQTLFRGGSLHSTNIFDEYTITQRLLSFPLLVMFFFPEVLGNSQSFNLRKIAGVDIINFNGAIAFLPMLFALWGCFTLWKSKEVRPFIIIAALGILLPIATPLFSVVYHRFFIISSFSFCIIGAIALQSFIQSEEVRSAFIKYFKWSKIVFVLMAAVLGGVGIYIGSNYQSVLSQFTARVLPKISGSAFGAGNESWMLGRVEKTLHYYSSFSPELWIPLISAAIMIAALTFYYKAKISGRIMLMIFFIGTAMQLVITARTWFPSVDPNQFPVYPDNGITKFLQANSNKGRYMVWRDPSKDQYILAENASNVYGIYDLHGYEVCSNRSMSLFFYKYSTYDSSAFRLLGLGNVKYILAGKAQLTSSSLQKVFASDNMIIYENLLSKPRAYLTHRSKIVGSDSSVVQELLRSDFDGSEAVFTQDDAPSVLSLSDKGRDSILPERSEKEEVSMRVETDSKGVFILTDTYYPGWKCYVNGKETPIYRVNYCMRGVILDPGKSNIIFKFEPDIFKAGAAISTIAVFLCLGGIPILKRRRKIPNGGNEAV